MNTLTHAHLPHHQGLGIDLGGTKLLIVCGERTFHTSTGPGFGPEHLMQHLEAVCADWSLQPAAIGLAVPGLVDAYGGVAECDVLPAFRQWPARQALQARWGDQVAVAVLNDVKAALAEEFADAPADFTGVLVMAGTAIGCGLKVDGRVLRGTDGWAGELGYWPVQQPGGGWLRLDELAGGAFMAARHGVSPAELARLAEAGDPATRVVIDAGATALGAALAGLVNLLNPSVVAVGGGAFHLAGYWPRVRETLYQQALPLLGARCTLRRVTAGASVVALGALRTAHAGSVFLLKP